MKMRLGLHGASMAARTHARTQADKHWVTADSTTRATGGVGGLRLPPGLALVAEYVQRSGGDGELQVAG